MELHQLDMKIKFKLWLPLLLVLFASAKANAQEFYDPPDYETSFFEKSGDVLEYAMPAGTGLIILLEKDIKGAKQFALAYGSTIVLTYALKNVIEKERPQSNKPRFDSFPSGHTASAFSSASFLQRRYGWQYGLPAYALATYVGISRVEGKVQHHDYVDVLGAAAIAVGFTYIFTSPRAREIPQVSFNSRDKQFLISWNYRF